MKHTYKSYHIFDKLWNICKTRIRQPQAFAQQPFSSLLRSNDSNRIEPMSDCVLFLKQVVAVCVCGRDRGQGQDGGRLLFFFFIASRTFFGIKFPTFKWWLQSSCLGAFMNCESKREKHLSAQKFRWISPSYLFNSYTERQWAFILEGKKIHHFHIQFLYCL